MTLDHSVDDQDQKYPRHRLLPGRMGQLGPAEGTVRRPFDENILTMRTFFQIGFRGRAHFESSALGGSEAEIHPQKPPVSAGRPSFRYSSTPPRISTLSHVRVGCVTLMRTGALQDTFRNVHPPITENFNRRRVGRRLRPPPEQPRRAPSPAVAPPRRRRR